jgi:hypothetical protein
MISAGPTTIDVEEKTEVIYGAQNIIESTLNLCSVARFTVDNCVDSNCPSMLVIPDHPITKATRSKNKIHYRNYKREYTLLQRVNEFC